MIENGAPVDVVIGDFARRRGRAEMEDADERDFVFERRCAVGAATSLPRHDGKRRGFVTRDYRIKRASLTEQVTDLLERYIDENALRPGDELPTEMDLAQLFGVSRTVIREGLSAAGARGLIEAETGRRSRVAELTGHALDGFFSNAIRLNAGAVVELLEVRAALEVYGVRLAVQHREPSELERLEAYLGAMDAALRDDDPERFVDADVKFHVTLVEMSRNEVLLHLIRALRTATRETIAKGLQARTSGPDLAEIQRVHMEIYAAVRDADAQAAADAVTEHFVLAIAALRGSDGTAALRVAEASDDPR